MTDRRTRPSRQRCQWRGLLAWLAAVLLALTPVGAHAMPDAEVGGTIAICTASGLKQVPVDDGGGRSASHGHDCSLCAASSQQRGLVPVAIAVPMPGADVRFRPVRPADDAGRFPVVAMAQARGPPAGVI